METEKNTPDCPSPSPPPPTCRTQTNSCTLLCYKPGGGGGGAVCSVCLIHSNRRRCLLFFELHSSDLTSTSQELAQRVCICQDSDLTVDLLLLAIRCALRLEFGSRLFSICFLTALAENTTSVVIVIYSDALIFD